MRRDDSGDFRAGARIVQLGTQALSDETLVELSRAEMLDLEAATTESVYLSVAGHRETALYIGIVEGRQSVRHTDWIGRTIPLDGSASGAVLRGATPEAGFVVVERGIEPDVTAIAAPITAAGRVVASLSILVPSYRMSPERTAHHGGLLRDAARRISERFAGSDPRRNASGKDAP